MNRRTKKLAMDFLCGISAATLAEQEGVGSARIYQIIDKAKKAIDWHPGMHPTEAGARMRKTSRWQEYPRHGVEEFYAEELAREQHNKDSVPGPLLGKQWPLGFPFKPSMGGSQ